LELKERKDYSGIPRKVKIREREGWLDTGAIFLYLGATRNPQHPIYCIDLRRNYTILIFFKESDPSRPERQAAGAS
jgi:hypothetical protein